MIKVNKNQANTEIHKQYKDKNKQQQIANNYKNKQKRKQTHIKDTRTCKQTQTTSDE